VSTPASFVARRLQPVHGARLTAADLRDLPALVDHQRRRHVRALHETWGIAAGLGFTLDEARTPIIQSGVAYDRHGRLLVLPRTVALPSAAQLPAAPADDGSAPAPGAPVIVVLRADVAAGEPAAVLGLRSRDDRVEHGVDIVLGTVQAHGRDIVSRESGRRYARIAAPVTLGSGFVRRGTLPATGTMHEWRARVPADAGFGDAPAYVVRVGPSRLAELGIAMVQIANRDPDGIDIVVRRARASELPKPGAKNPPPPAFEPVSTNPEDITWIGALPQRLAHVPFLVPPTGPYPGFFSPREHR